MEIPDVKDEDDDEYKVRTVNLRYEEEEEPEPWARSLPELQDWNKHASESSFDDSELFHQDFEDDPVYRLLIDCCYEKLRCCDYWRWGGRVDVCADGWTERA